MNIEFIDTDYNGVVAEVTLNKEECDVARDCKNTALMNGAKSVRVFFDSDGNEYYFRVRTNSERKARKACEAWIDDIQEELE